MSKSIHEMIKESVTQRLNDLGIEINEQLAEFINYERLDSAIDSMLEKIAQEQKYSFKDGDVYWFVDSVGRVYTMVWVNDYFDQQALENNAIFKTQEEAEFEAERLKVLRELEKLGRAFELSSLNYFISCKHSVGDSSELIIGCATLGHSCYGKHYFDDEKEAREAIEKIGAKRIKKYLFGIEE